MWGASGLPTPSKPGPGVCGASHYSGDSLQRPIHIICSLMHSLSHWLSPVEPRPCPLGVAGLSGPTSLLVRGDTCCARGVYSTGGHFTPFWK